MGKRYERERKTKEKDTREKERHRRETLLGDLRGNKYSRGHGKKI